MRLQKATTLRFAWSYLCRLTKLESLMVFLKLRTTHKYTQQQQKTYIRKPQNIRFIERRMPSAALGQYGLPYKPVPFSQQRTARPNSLNPVYPGSVTGSSHP